MNEVLKNRILPLLEKMNESQLLIADLYQELQNSLLIKTDDELQRDHDKLTGSCDTLENFLEQCNNKREQHQLNTDKMAKRSKLLLESLRAYSNDADHFSVYAILIKLELILFDVLDDNSMSAEKTTSNNSLIDVYSMKSGEKQFQQSVIINDDDEEEAKNDERLYLLNELMDAPLDDITTFMQRFSWSFEKLYAYQVFDEILYRLQNPIAFSNSSSDEIDQLCVCIKKKLTKKYDLNRMELISLLANQFHFITPNKYRIYLEQFVNDNKTAPFTLQNFYSFHGIPAVLSSEDDRNFATLFSIYCRKLLGEDTSRRSSQSVQIVSSTNRREEGRTNSSRPYKQNRIGRNTNDHIHSLKYNAQKQNNIQNSPQTMKQLEQKAVPCNTQHQNQRNKYGVNNNKMRSGYQMSLPYVC